MNHSARSAHSTRRLTGLLLLLSLGFTTTVHAQPSVTAAAANDDRTQTTLTFSETVVLNTTSTSATTDADDWTITQTGATPATITPTAISIPIATGTGTTTVTLTHAVLSSAATAYRLSYGRGDNGIISATSQPLANVPTDVTQVLLHIPDGNVRVGFLANTSEQFVFILGSLSIAITADNHLSSEADKDTILGYLGLTALDGTPNDVPDTRAEIIPWMTGLGITFSGCTGTGENACTADDAIHLSNISVANGIPIVLPPGVTLSATSGSATENGGTTEYTVVLDTQPTGNVTITPTSGNTNAATVSGALTFTDSNWDSAQTITVTGVDDDIDNATDRTATISHTVSGGGYGSVTVGTFTFTANDDDTAGVTLSPTGGSATEDGDTAIYNVVLGSEPTASVTVTPTSGTLTTATVSGALTFTMTNWDTAQTVTVTGVDDDIDNASNRTATISHAATSSDGDYSGITIETYMFTATDDDTAAVTLSATSGNATEDGGTASYTAVLDTEPGGNVTITPASDDSTTATVSGVLTFTTSNWDTAQTITVTGVDDAIQNSSNRTATISHTASGYGSVTVGNFIFTANDDDVPGLRFSTASLTVAEAGSETYTVRLNTAPTADVTVTPTSGSTAATVSGALTFTDSNFGTAQTITVTGVDDDNGTDETFNVTHAASGGDYGSITGNVAVTTTDDDTAGVTLSPTSDNAGEDGGTASYTVVLDTEPSGNVTITPTSGTLTTATVSGALIFTMTNWDTAQAITVTGVNDDIDNASNRTATISHTASGGGYGSVTVGDYSFTANDDDTEDLSFTPGSVNVGEASTVDYTVELNTEPSGNVIVTPTSANTDAATVSGALTFTDSNWDTAQTVTVTGVDDDNSASEIFDITHAASGGGYDAVTGDVDVTTTDDDAPVTDNAQLNETVLPQVTQAVVRHTQGTVARRVEQVASNSLTIGDQSSLATGLAETLSTQADAINAGNLKDLLGNTDFVLPLHAASAKGSGVASSLALWGGGEYRSLSDDEVGPDTLDWDGDLFSATLGIDANLRNNILLGVAGSWSDVDVDYRQGNTQAGGDYSLSLVGVHPYLAWTGKRLSWWFTGGYGDGELSISDEVNENSSDVTLLSLGTGASGVLWADQLTTLRLKGDILWAEMDVEGGDDISPYTTDVNGSRLLLEASQVHSLDGGVSLEPSLELGVRYDGGDGDDRTHMELGAGLRLHGNRLTLDGSVYALLGEDNLGDWDIREWGVRGLLHLQAGRDGEGLSFSLTPGYGAPQRDALLWKEDGNASHLLDTQGNHYREYSMRLDTELGYGIPAGQGMLSPYGQMSLGDGQRYRLGLRWSRTELFELELEGERRQRDSQGDGGNADNAILLQGRLRF